MHGSSTPLPPEGHFVFILFPLVAVTGVAKPVGQPLAVNLGNHFCVFVLIFFKSKLLDGFHSLLLLLTYLLVNRSFAHSLSGYVVKGYLVLLIYSYETEVCSELSPFSFNDDF